MKVWAARGGSPGIENAPFWYSAAEKLLAPLLLAAVHADLTMADVISWLDTKAVDQVNWGLELAGEPAALNAFAATTTREKRTRSNVYATAETVLAAYADPGVLASAETSDLRAERLLHVLHAVGADPRALPRVQRARPLRPRRVAAAGNRGQRFAPVLRELAVGHDDLGEQAVVDERDQVVLGADVVVEAHRPHPERPRDIAHRDRVEALVVGDLDRHGGDPVTREARPAPARLGAQPDRLA